MLRQGTRLINGAIVVATFRSVILASWRGEFVTWIVGRDGSLYSGNYHTDPVKAQIDYRDRLLTGR